MKTVQIRLTDEEHRQLVIAAGADGRSLNKFIGRLIAADREKWEKLAAKEADL